MFITGFATPHLPLSEKPFLVAQATLPASTLEVFFQQLASGTSGLTDDLVSLLVKGAPVVSRALSFAAKGTPVIGAVADVLFNADHASGSEAQGLAHVKAQEIFLQQLAHSYPQDLSFIRGKGLQNIHSKIMVYEIRNSGLYKKNPGLSSDLTFRPMSYGYERGLPARAITRGNTPGLPGTIRAPLLEQNVAVASSVRIQSIAQSSQRSSQLSPVQTSPVSRDELITQFVMNAQNLKGHVVAQAYWYKAIKTWAKEERLTGPQLLLAVKNLASSQELMMRLMINGVGFAAADMFPDILNTSDKRSAFGAALISRYLSDVKQGKIVQKSIWYTGVLNYLSHLKSSITQEGYPKGVLKDLMVRSGLITQAKPKTPQNFIPAPSIPAPPARTGNASQTPTVAKVSNTGTPPLPPYNPGPDPNKKSAELRTSSQKIIVSSLRILGVQQASNAISQAGIAAFQHMVREERTTPYHGNINSDIESLVANPDAYIRANYHVTIAGVPLAEAGKHSLGHLKKYDDGKGHVEYMRVVPEFLYNKLVEDQKNRNIDGKEVGFQQEKITDKNGNVSVIAVKYVPPQRGNILEDVKVDVQQAQGSKPDSFSFRAFVTWGRKDAFHGSLQGEVTWNYRYQTTDKPLRMLRFKSGSVTQNPGIDARSQVTSNLYNLAVVLEPFKFGHKHIENLTNRNAWTSNKEISVNSTHLFFTAGERDRAIVNIVDKTGFLSGINLSQSWFIETGATGSYVQMATPKSVTAAGYNLGLSQAASGALEKVPLLSRTSKVTSTFEKMLTEIDPTFLQFTTTAGPQLEDISPAFASFSNLKRAKTWQAEQAGKAFLGDKK